MIKIANKDALMNLNPDECRNVDIPPEEILNWLIILDGYWEHSGDPNMPHAELTSGKHSNGFADWWRLLSYSHLCQIVANQLVRKIKKYGITFKREDWCIGSAYAAVDLSKDVANILGIRHGIAEKGEDKKMLWNRLTIQKGELVLQVEELITTIGDPATLGTLERVKKGIIDGNAIQPVEFQPIAGILFNRSGKKEFEGTSLVSLIEKNIVNWDSKEVCPLCKKGSKALRPKQNWAELTGKA